MRTGRGRALGRRRRLLEGRLRTEARRVAGLGRLRVVSFALAVGALAAVVPLPERSAELRWCALAAAVAFVTAAVLQAAPRRRERHLAGTLDALGRDEARAAGHWRELPRTGEGLAAACPFADDLALVGDWSLFRAISRCATPFGERRLAHLLAEGAPVSEIDERQGAVRELGRREGLRHRVEAEGSRGAVDGAAPAELLRQVAARPSVHDGRPWLAPAAALLGAATLLQVLHLLGTGRPLLLGYFLAAQAALFLILRRRVEEEYLGLLPHEDSVAAWTGALSLVESHRFRAAMNRRLRRRVEGASRALRGLHLRLGGLTLRWTALHPVLNILLPWDLLHVRLLRDWRLRHGAAAADWFEVLGEWESLASLAGHAAEQELASFAEIDPSGPAWEAEAVRHPLLPEEEAVPNSILLDEAGTVLLVTGSNMSGKSTLLRTVGLNTVLAQAGGACCAARLRLRPCRLGTSIHVSDALDAGVSLFHAEVRRLKAILDEVERADEDPQVRPVLFLVDEILRGTNTRERVIASRAVIRRLAASRSAGLVSSHEIALAELARELPSLRNVHFRESVGPAGMSFDFLMRAGPVTTTNALEVLRREGVALDFEAEASS